MSIVSDHGSRRSEVAVFKSLADATRLRLIRLLFREELNVQELSNVLQMGQSRVSRHLAVLRNAGLARDRRQGTKIYYTLLPMEETLPAFSAYVEALGKSQHPDLDRLGNVLASRRTEVHAFADGNAAQWDEIGRLLHSSSASLLALAGLLPKAGTLADLGTGTGIMLPFLSASCTHVYAVDQSARMLEQARQRCRRLGVGNVTFIQGSVEDLGEQVPTCDGLLMHFVLHQVSRPKALLGRLFDFVKPGGHLVVVDRVQHQDEKAKTVFGSIWLGFAPEQVHGWLGAAGFGELSWHALAGADRASETDFDLFVAAGQSPPHGQP